MNPTTLAEPIQRAGIHPLAVVAPTAVVPASCTVGPFCTVGPDVVLGEECVLVSHVVLDGRLTAGDRNHFSPFAAVGVPPQDLKYRGEPTAVVLGSDNVIRESVTVSRGTAGGGGVTRIGSNCLLMACAHIGHDSSVGDHCILANAATLAGHVHIDDYATVGAFSAVHQFCRVGRYAFIGGGSMVTQDILPFSLNSEKREIRAYGINKIGLERRGFSPERLRGLHHAFHLLLRSKRNTAQAIEAMRRELEAASACTEDEAAGRAAAHADIAYLIAFVESSARGIIK